MKFATWAAAAVLSIAPFAAQAVTYTSDTSTPMHLTSVGGVATAPAVGGTNALVASNTYSGALLANGALGAGFMLFEFSSATDPLGAFEVSTALPALGNPFATPGFGSSMEVAWINESGKDDLVASGSGSISGTVDTLDIIGVDVNGNGDGIYQQSEFSDPMVALFTNFTAPNTTQWLAVSWDSVASSDSATLRVQAVPGPLGILLIGTAFAAAGAARRFGRKAA
ncbi:MAG: hypothetical protein AAFU61_00135 [Pseudomonadota bacterium]